MSGAIRRAVVAALVTGAVVVTPWAATAVMAPIETTGPVRIAGPDRYATAVEVSKRTFPAPQDAVFLASGEDYPDALAAGPVAARLGAPVLLVRQGTLPEQVAAELARLKPSRVYVLGGTAVISDDVSSRAAVASGGHVQRVHGPDRYATAAAAAQLPAATHTIYLASGQGFADALAGGAAAARQDASILLTTRDRLPAATESALKAINPSTVVVLGGTGAVGADVTARVMTALPAASVTTLAGKDRYETASLVAQGAWPGSAPSVFYAPGDSFPDALAGTPAALVNDGPILLTRATCVPSPTAATASALKPARQISLGGTSVTYAGGTVCGSGPVAGTALAALATLPVKGRAPRTGYDRDLFGPAWTDDNDVNGGRNGCDTRNDVLRRDLTAPVIRAGTQGCLVERGTLIDPYSGLTQQFVRGASTSGEVQIDHVVALSDAWQKGAQQLTERERRNFANDPLNLQATNGRLNQQKGAGDAATWLPPLTSYRCAYVARQVAVKAHYNIWVTAAEKDAIARILATCPTQPLPTTASTAVPAPVR